jgi:hypothetical protein
VPFPVDGPFSFTLAGTGRVLNVTKSTGFRASLAWGTWSLTLSGKFDCDTQTLSGTVNGKLAAAPLNITLAGTLTGTLDPGGGSGTWQEQETSSPNQATACAGATIPPNGTGCGKWTITSRP